MNNNKKISWADEYLGLINDSSLSAEIPYLKDLQKSVIITGASVSGKTTLFRCLVAYFNLKPIPVHTTRKLRGDEVFDIDSVFISEEEFKDRFNKGDYMQDSLESSYFSGAYYGCPYEWINSVNSGKINCFVCPTVKIAKKVKEILGDKIFWIHMVANKAVRQQRLERRNPDMSQEDIILRIERGSANIDISGHDLVIDTSYLGAKDIFIKAINNF